MSKHYDFFSGILVQMLSLCYNTKLFDYVNLFQVENLMYIYISFQKKSKECLPLNFTYFNLLYMKINILKLKATASSVF